jgi:hypothetical protein
MAYARISEIGIAEYPLYEGDIKLRFPNTSFPKPFEPPADYVRVRAVPQPSISWDENIAEGAPVQLQNEWTQVWVVSPASANEISQRTSAQASAVRADRNKRLADCDWTQLPDAPVDAAVWAAYRQALRDVTEQPGFPWSIEWPQQP